MNIPLEYVSDEVLDILQGMAQERKRLAHEKIQIIVAERVRRSGGINQVCMDWENHENHL